MPVLQYPGMLQGVLGKGSNIMLGMVLGGINVDIY